LRLKMNLLSVKGQKSTGRGWAASRRPGETGTGAEEKPGFGVKEPVRKNNKKSLRGAWEYILRMFGVRS